MPSASASTSSAKLDLIRPQPYTDWSPEVDGATKADLRRQLEQGAVLYFPDLHFRFEPGEERFLDSRYSDGKSKNINLRAGDTAVRGAQGSEQDRADLYRLIRRYADFSEKLVLSLFPEYAPYMTRAGTSLRPSQIAGRAVSWRKDDTRLHVDSFPSNPLLGKRLLRVFHNIDPEAPRVWRVGEPFADFAQRFVPKTHGMWPGQAALMKLLHITKRTRSEYDHRMLQLHDLAKADLDYQASVPQQEFHFPPGSTWIVFSDQLLHAAMRGRAMMEQTIYLDPKAISDHTHSPEAVLSRMLGRPMLLS
ncbi:MULTISPECIES: Kdo hydroxylase family protein [Cupriavidus]|uniref:3-deoxy-D-manno-oct-2-ulosonic acid (Kdo) hydroxylase n=1 Tax=Cupriavidus pinatubonensis (strain JMP 134 / LMG 1197) TaxID=264198 RepID=Q476U9_CUPPJ|nr:MULTISPECIES: Kdo hydroxylase family protein [Cupriavidus]QYY31824.1 Kdo hydroxylase family protein [Cupriavidus pinatubonensis]TPQ42106.1 3-deoxy-D-manno-oct-2-ulosonic acid (Kdo) hydroxylase [Cupriavidus pinatubonensis]